MFSCRLGTKSSGSGPLVTGTIVKSYDPVSFTASSDMIPGYTFVADTMTAAAKGFRLNAPQEGL